MRIAIVGAGLAGLFAARELQRAGHDVRLFEKSRGRGGRLASKRFDWAQFDLGAQYFTVKTPAFQQEVDTWLSAACVREWQFTPYKFDGSSLHPSPDSTLRYVGYPQMNSIAHHLADGLNIHFTQRVTELKKEDALWTLVTEEQGYAGFDFVVLTPPAEQSKVLVKDYAIANAIPDDVHSPCWALAMTTEDEVDAAIQGIFGDETLSWVSRQSAKPGYGQQTPGQNTWVVHFSPSWSEKYGKTCGEAEILETATRWLNRALASDLKVQDHYLHYWRYANLHMNTFDQPFLFDEKQNIAVVGAWCVGGKVEGAFISADRFCEFFI